MYDDTSDNGASDGQHSLRSEELAAQRTATIGRTIALCLIVPLSTYMVPWPGPVFTYGLLVVFALLGWAAWFVAQSDWGKPWHQYAFVSLDAAFLTFALLFPNPLLPFDSPPQMIFRFGVFPFYFVLLAGLTYVYKPRLVLWGGLSAAVCWCAGLLWMLLLPDTIWQHEAPDGVDSLLAHLAEPTFIDFSARIQEIAVLLIVAGLLALAVKRSRTVALRQAKLGRERENLGRYFSRQTAQMLAERADPFADPNEHHCAVLFADLVAFTAWSEKHTSRETIALLRSVHGMLADVVFRHNGTLDKFIGDGVMATFGTPEPTASDASNALAAMVDMHRSFEAWRASRPPGQGANLRLAIGVHYGPVVIGNVGSARRLEFAVLGDTVNVASRLEGATRALACHCLASAALVDAATREETSLDVVHACLTYHGAIPIRGRDAMIDVYKI